MYQEAATTCVHELEKKVQDAGLSHSPTLNASLADSIPFVKRLLAGEAIQSTCQSGPIKN